MNHAETSAPDCVVIGDLRSRCVSTSDEWITRYGNIEATAVPICLHEALSEGRIEDGDPVVPVALGTGCSWGATLLRW